MNAGWPFADFRQVTGFDLREQWQSEIEQVTERGWGRVTEDRFGLTRSGLRFADSVAEMFVR